MACLDDFVLFPFVSLCLFPAIGLLPLLLPMRVWVLLAFFMIIMLNQAPQSSWELMVRVVLSVMTLVFGSLRGLWLLFAWMAMSLL